MLEKLTLFKIFCAPRSSSTTTTWGFLETAEPLRAKALQVPSKSQEYRTIKYFLFICQKNRGNQKANEDGMIPALKKQNKNGKFQAVLVKIYIYEPSP